MIAGWLRGLSRLPSELGGLAIPRAVVVLPALAVFLFLAPASVRADSIIEAVAEADRWTGQMFAGAQDAFVPVTLSFQAPDTLVVVAEEGAGGPTEVLRLIRGPARHR